MRSFVFIPLLLISFHACGACLGDQKAKDHPYSFYVLPQLAISETYRSWTPVLERVGKKIEMCFDLYVPQGFTYFEEAVKAGKADFAFMNPYHMMMAKRSGGYLPVIAGGKDKISGIVVVKNDGTINKLEELDGKKMAFPAPLALGATLLVRAYLAEKNIHVIPEYVKSHSNVYRSVLVGDVVAGGGANSTLHREPAALQQEFKILYETPKFISYPIAVNPRIPVKIRKSFAQGFIEIAKEPDMRDKLEAIAVSDPVEVEYSRDYQYIEKLRLDRFVEKTGG